MIRTKKFENLPQITSISPSGKIVVTENGVDKVISFEDFSNLPPANDVWNNASTTFTASEVNVTDIQSAADSKLLDLKINTVSKFVVRKDGNLGIGVANPAARLDISDTVLAGSGSLAGSILNLAQTWNTTGNPTAIKLNVTNTASGATSNLLDLQVGGSSIFNVKKDGQILISNLNSVSSLAPNGYITINPNGSGKILLASQYSALGIQMGGGFSILSASTGKLMVGSILYLNQNSYGTGANFVFSVKGEANLRLGDIDAAVPVAQTLSVQSVIAGTTNTAGANFTIDGSQGTGTGVGGSIIFRTAKATTSSSTVNSLTEALTIDSERNITIGGAYNDFSFKVPAGGGSRSFSIIDGVNRIFQTSTNGLVSVGYIAMGASTPNPDIFFQRDAANNLALRNGVNPQTFRVYNTFPGTGNNEFGEITWDSSTLYFRPAASGTATVRNITIGSTQSTTFFDGAVITFRPSGSPKFGMNSGGFFATNDNQVDIGFSNGSRPRNLFIASNICAEGKVGIGTNVPLAKLDITETWNSNISVTGASGTGSVATVTFATQAAVIPVGATVVVSSVNPSGYNGTFVVTASTVTSISYTNSTSTTYVSGGTVQQLFTAVKVNVTDTASNAGSNLLDLQVGGVSKFRFLKGGVFLSGTVEISGNAIYGAPIGWPGSPSWGGIQQLNMYSGSATTGFIQWNNDLFLYRDAANTLAQRNGVNPQAFRLYGTYTDASNYARLAISCDSSGNAILATEGLGTGAAGTLSINGVPVGLGKGNISSNIAIGTSALTISSTGNNTAIGYFSSNAVTSQNNVSVGAYSLQNNNSGHNVGIGPYTLQQGGAFESVAVGAFCFQKMGGSSNTAIGAYAMQGTNFGSGNNAFGRHAGRYITDGTTSNYTCNNSIFIGANTKALADNQTNQIVIGDSAIGIGSNSVVLGNDSILTTVLKGKVGIGTTAPGAPLHLQAISSTNTRESLLKCTVSDAGNDAFYVYNSTSVDGAFMPGFGGCVYSSSLRHCLVFKGQTDFANDGGSVPMILYQAARAENQTDPNNAEYFTINNRPLFAWNNLTTTYMQMSANGNLGLGTVTPAAKLDVVSSSTAGSRFGDGTRYVALGSNSNANWVDGNGSVPTAIAAGNNGNIFSYASNGVYFGTYLGTLFGDPGAGKAVFAGLVGIGAAPAAKLDIADTTLAGSGSLAGSILNLAQTWNTTGTPTAIKLNVTNTASGAASHLLDLQVGEASKFKVGKDGTIYLQPWNGFFTYLRQPTNSYSFGIGLTNTSGSYGDVGLFQTTSGGIGPGWDVANFAGRYSINGDTILTRDAANTLALRNGVNPQAFRLYNTYTDATTFERLNIKWDTNVLKIGTEKGAGGGTARNLALETDGTTRMTITSAGNVGIGVSGASTGAEILYLSNVFSSTNVTYLRIDNTNSNGSIGLRLGSASAKADFYYDNVTTQTYLRGLGGALHIGTFSGDGNAYVTFTSFQQERMRITGAGNVGIGTTTPAEKLDVVGNLKVSGHLSAATKSFLIDHPTKEGKKLQYGVVESNQHSVLVRGKTAENIIELPEEWAGLVHEDSVTVQLTPIGSYQQLFVISQDNQRVVVGGSTGQYNYTIYGERKDVDKLITEI